MVVNIVIGQSWGTLKKSTNLWISCHWKTFM